MKQILIVEDHESMIDAITLAFQSTNEYQVCGTLANASLCELFCERLKPDLILMDVCTEGNASGLVATKTIKEKFPTIKIIIMTAFDELSYLPCAKSAGADGFVYKSKSLNSFITTANQVMNGEKCFPEQKSIPIPDGEVPLTDREMEVLRLICKNKTNKEIAEELFITENTVKYHKAAMLAKTGFKKTIDLAFYMISNGWINPLY